jgi:putative transcriptional regulator
MGSSDTNGADLPGRWCELLVCGTIGGMDSLKGRLLISGAGLFDPNFRHTVVLLAEHGEDGAFGVVLNRPLAVTVGDAASELAGLVAPDEPLYAGGPVEPGRAIIVAEFEHPEFVTQPVVGSIGLLPGGEIPSGLVRARVYAGHSGWGAAQLDAEINAEAWIIEDARPEDVFCAEPKQLWSSVLRRKGDAYTMLSTMPFDPTMN